MSAPAEKRGPEKAPQRGRRLLFTSAQLIGAAALLAVPVLALCGLLGDSREVLVAHHDGLTLRADTCARARNGNAMQMRLTLEGAGLAGRQVRIDVSSEYLSPFVNLMTQPSATGVSGEAVTFVQDMPAAGAASVILDLTPDGYGWARGRVRAVADSGATVELPLKTFILP